MQPFFFISPLQSLVMQFFDLSRQFNLSNILTPYKTLEDLARQEWFLSKVRVEHDCLSDSEMVEGQVVLKSNQNIQIALEWQIQAMNFWFSLKGSKQLQAKRLLFW